jgi:hypothetical protein
VVDLRFELDDEVAVCTSSLWSFLDSSADENDVEGGTYTCQMWFVISVSIGTAWMMTFRRLCPLSLGELFWALVSDIDSEKWSFIALQVRGEEGPTREGWKFHYENQWVVTRR